MYYFVTSTAPWYYKSNYIQFIIKLPLSDDPFKFVYRGLSLSKDERFVFLYFFQRVEEEFVFRLLLANNDLLCNVFVGAQLS